MIATPTSRKDATLHVRNYRPEVLPAGQIAGIAFTQRSIVLGFRPADATRCSDKGEIWREMPDRRGVLHGYGIP